MIRPTVGRIVWFYPAMGDEHFPPGGPYAAMVCWVHSDSLVNLVAYNGNGDGQGRSSVRLLQDGEPNPDGATAFCEWMPYQKQVAAGEIAPLLHAKS